MEFTKVNVSLGGGSLLMVANRTPCQMMSYVIDCPDGGCVLIDGGFYADGDANHLAELLAERGNHVNYWFISHAHDDHIGALTKLMEREGFAVAIDHLCMAFPDLNWLSQREDWEVNQKFLSLIEKHHISLLRPSVGDVYECGGISFKILYVPIKEDYEHYKEINSTSLIFKACFPKREVLFLGDVHSEAENNLLDRYGDEYFRTDIVQMAHHGQWAVTKRFYEAVMPKICLYNAPDWLWENRLPGFLPIPPPRGWAPSPSWRRGVGWMSLALKPPIPLPREIFCLSNFSSFLKGFFFFLERIFLPS